MLDTSGSGSSSVGGDGFCFEGLFTRFRTFLCLVSLRLVPPFASVFYSVPLVCHYSINTSSRLCQEERGETHHYTEKPSPQAVTLVLCLCPSCHQSRLPVARAHPASPFPLSQQSEPMCTLLVRVILFAPAAFTRSCGASHPSQTHTALVSLS
jgi:hypothetical protein